MISNIKLLGIVLGIGLAFSFADRREAFAKKHPNASANTQVVRHLKHAMKATYHAGRFNQTLIDKTRRNPLESKYFASRSKGPRLIASTNKRSSGPKLEFHHAVFPGAPQLIDRVYLKRSPGYWLRKLTGRGWKTLALSKSKDLKELQSYFPELKNPTQTKKIVNQLSDRFGYLRIGE